MFAGVNEFADLVDVGFIDDLVNDSLCDPTLTLSPSQSTASPTTTEPTTAAPVGGPSTSPSITPCADEMPFCATFQAVPTLCSIHPDGPLRCPIACDGVCRTAAPTAGGVSFCAAL